MNSDTAAMKPNHALKPGTIITHHNLNGEDREYTVVKVLGQPGGFGITYLATFLATNQVSGNMGSFDSTAEVNVAIKEFFMNGCGRNSDGSVNIGTVDPEVFQTFKDQFNNEANVLSRFNHLRYLVKVIDFFEANGTAYMVMKHITGSDVSEIVSPNKPLEEAIAVKYILQVAEDLRDVHDEGIVHRDIKPSNLMIHRFTDPKTRDKQQIATLIDFGAAKDYSEGNEISEYNIHTEAYAAPEQVDPWGKKGRFTDIYSLCGLLYFMIEGRKPPVVTTRNETDPPLQLNRASPEIARIIDKGMSFKAENRYQDCLDLIMAFNEIGKWSDLYDREVVYDKPTIEGRRPTIIRKNPVDPRDGRGLEPGRESAGGKKQKVSTAVIAFVSIVFLAVVGAIVWMNIGESDDPEEQVSATNTEAVQLMMNPVTGMENGGDIQVPVTLDKPVEAGFTVEVNSSGGTATEGSDYTLLTQQLTFSGNENETQNIIIRPIDDLEAEADEMININLSSISNTEAEVDLGDGVVVTIGNDDGLVTAIPGNVKDKPTTNQTQPEETTPRPEEKDEPRLIAMSMDDYLGKLIDESYSYRRREDLMIREMRLYFPAGSAISTYANMSDAQLAEDYLKEFISKASLINQLNFVEEKQAKTGVKVFVLNETRIENN